jgi:hypothetical protein
MLKKLEISPEVTRLIQRSCQQKRLAFEKELARYVVEQAVVELDSDLELIVDGASALAEIAPLAKSLGLNDIVVNDRHIHVSVLAANGKVGISKALLHTAYLEIGILVVKTDDGQGGTIVGHIDHSALISSSIETSDLDELELDFHPQDNFSLAAFFTNLAKMPKAEQRTTVKLTAEDWLTLVRDRSSLPIEKQRQMISALLNPTVQENLALVLRIDEDKLSETLREAAIWHARAQRFSDRLAAKFRLTNPAKVKEAVLRAGEICGGQTELPEFRKAVLSELTREAISAKLTAGAAAQIQALIDQVYAGASALSTVKRFVKNQLTVDLAQAINDQRQGLISFANATVEEFGSAFTTLQLQPSYATHSQKDNVGLDAVNEALIFRETAKLVEQVKELEL